MRLAVVILNWNATEETKRCLLEVRRWGDSAGIPPRTIWVVDNASHEPGVKSLEREHPDVRFLMSPVNRGFAGGNNLGIVAAMEHGGDAIALLNNDATLDGRSVASMVSTLSSDSRIGVVGPVLSDGNPLLSLGGRDIAHHMGSHLRARDPPDRLLDVDYVPGTAVLIRRRTFEEIGLLDEDYFFSGEMADLCRRARRQGLRCVTDPGARASHDLRRSSELRETLHAYYALRNRFLYVRKHHPKRRGRLYLTWSLRAAFAVTAALARSRPGRARAMTLGVFDGLRGRFGGQNDRVSR